MSEEHQVSSAVGAPILFRTTSEEVRRATLETGSLWLRSAQYYANSEDQVRNDETEGMSASRGTVPLRLGAVQFTRVGTLARQTVPHYILSLHGVCISKEQHRSFGGCSFGIKERWRLAMAIYHEVEKQIDCIGFRYGPVNYRHGCLSLMRNRVGEPVTLPGDLHLGPEDADFLTKPPIHPFIEQDEYRIAMFTNGYIGNDFNAPLKINVPTSHFYPYHFEIA